MFGFDVGLKEARLKVDVRLKRVTSGAEMKRALSGSSRRDIGRR